jgi:hypothetical protein
LSDNGLKKELWIKTAIEINGVYYGKKVPLDKIKNKWVSDIKEKWEYWVLVSDRSGFGWNEETEKFEACDYVWENLNKGYPRIIWHKSVITCHVLSRYALRDST